MSGQGVEGAGGVLVALDHQATTLADLVAVSGADTAGAIVVCRAALGTLNHTALIVEALQRRGVPIAGLVIGAWPQEPGEIERSNHRHLSGYGVPLLGTIPEQAGRLEPAEFKAAAAAWFQQAVR